MTGRRARPFAAGAVQARTSPSGFAIWLSSRPQTGLRAPLGSGGAAFATASPGDVDFSERAEGRNPEAERPTAPSRSSECLADRPQCEAPRETGSGFDATRPKVILSGFLAAGG